MLKGVLIPTEITINILEKAINENLHTKLLIDGFPRNNENLLGWIRCMRKQIEDERVLVLDCPEEICIKRIIKRSKNSNRIDDNEVCIKKRFETYYTETLPVIQYYDNINLVHKVNANLTAEEVFINIINIFNSK